MSKSNGKKFIVLTLLLTAAALLLAAAAVVVVDPMFHYHAPLPGISYALEAERYQNDGIVRMFDYDSIISGTSMTENFKVTDAERLFGGKFIKAPFSGARYKEINDNLIRAFSTEREIKLVIRSLDPKLLILDKDAYWEVLTFPDYLYNDDIFDDVNYIFNKDMLVKAMADVRDTITGVPGTTFDEYANWNDLHEYGLAAVQKTYKLKEPASAARVFTDDERQMVLDNIHQNITDIMDAHPETDFYLFIPPYSVCFWDEMVNKGELDWLLTGMETALTEVLARPNARVFAFCDEYDLITRMELYLDQTHFKEDVNAWMLEKIAAGEYELTADGLDDFIGSMREFFSGYDYAPLHVKEGKDAI